MVTRLAQTSLVAATIGAATFGLSAPAFAQDQELPEETSSAVDAAESAGVVETLTSGDEVTVFVPSNEALEAAPEDELSALMEDTDQLGQVIQSYAVSGTVLAEDAMQMASEEDGSTTVDTLAGGTLTVTTEGENVMVGPEGGPMATVVTPDLQVGNVTMHIIDTAFLPADSM